MGKLALVLSGGGARGAFQAGALVELLAHFEKTGRRINVLSGTSVGALNGMSIAQAASLREAASEIERQWRQLTNPDIYKIRGWGIFGLILKFATTRMDRWPFVRGVESLFDNTPLYNKYILNYFRHDAIRARSTVDQFYVSLSSLNTGAAYVRSITDESDRKKAMEYIMASTITTVAYPPVRTVVDDPRIPAPLQHTAQLYADGGISNKTPLKSVLRLGGISELYVVNTYPSYPNITEHSIRTRFPNVFALLMRTALELLPNLYFLRDMETVRDVNNDLESYANLRARVLDAAPGEAIREELERAFRAAEESFSFSQGGKQIIDPVIIAPDEELPVQDTEFVQPKLGETFDMGRAKAQRVLAARQEPRNEAPSPSMSLSQV
ncbi:MAG TPA: patatin-like phospholipase family protein [Bacteroidota bacterium]|nr:patatin-like phospholipase family protein [Bacteroidota bacterium]